MDTMTMCGMRCDLCKAYRPNVEKNDERERLSEVWRKCYNLDVPIEAIQCDGCRCDEPDAVRLDDGCPVRACVMEKELSHCGDCDAYPCDIFRQREGFTMEATRKLLGDRFCSQEYDDYLLAYDNATRLDAYVKSRQK